MTLLLINQYLYSRNFEQIYLLMNSLNHFSLLNNDYQTFAKMPIMCLKRVVPFLIHINKVDLIAGHLASDNSRYFSYYVQSQITSVSSCSNIVRGTKSI